jgi:hypothetical protein
MRHARKDYERFQDPAGLIPEDEPVFLIRGQDVVAPEVLRFYALRADGIGAHSDLVEAVEEHAERMREWQKKKKVKVPDLPK